MPARINDVAAIVFEQLQEERGLAPTTRAEYTRRLRGILALLPEEFTADDVEQVFMRLAEEKPAVFKVYRRSWELFLEFAAARNIAIPGATATDDDESSTCKLPDSVISALRAEPALDDLLPILCETRWCDISSEPIRWAGAVTGTSMFGVRIAGLAGWSTAISGSLLKALRDYARPDAAGLTALIPLCPGSHESRSEKELELMLFTKTSV